MRITQNIIDKMEKTQIGKRFVKEQRYRMVSVAAFSFLFNLLYALYHGVLGVLHLSLWFVTMCAFYIMLSTMRFSVILCDRKQSADTEYFVMKLSGVLLAMLSLVLSGVVYISLSQNIATKYGEIIMITIATYTSCKISMAIRRAVKQRKNPSPLLAVIRNISYAEIAASVLTLQRSMLVSFGSVSDTKAYTMNIATGAGVCLFVFVLGGALLIKGMKKGGNEMAKSGFVKANEKIEKTVVGAFEKIEDTVVGGYTKIEDTVVSGYTKLEDAFVERYLTKDGETVEEAKKRLKRENGTQK